jgi:PTS system nitrogen regulatory IIA component
MLPLKRIRLGGRKGRAPIPGEESGEASASGPRADVFSNDDGKRAAVSDPQMMNEAEFLIPARARCQAEITSKKKALEVLSELIAEGQEDLTPRLVLNCLVSREKLGSTGLGHGVAIPHGRMPEVRSAVGAALTLKDGVDFDAPDGEPVDIIVGLVVPEESTDEHLRILAKLAEAFSEPESTLALREAATPEELSSLLSGFLSKT